MQNEIRYREEEINVNKISPFIHRDRDSQGFNELVESINKYGLINPITVKTKNDGTYLLVKGEGRVLAHRELGLNKIKAFVFDVYKMGEKEVEKEVIIEWLVENKVREKLPPQDKARLIAYELKQGAKIDEVAKRYRVLPGTAQQYAKTVKESSGKLFDMVEKKKLSFTQVKEIAAAFKNPKSQEAVAEFVTEKKLPIKDTRTIVKIAKITEKKVKRHLSITDLREAVKALVSEKRSFKQLLIRTLRRTEILHKNLNTLIADARFLNLLKEHNIPILKEV